MAQKENINFLGICQRWSNLSRKEKKQFKLQKSFVKEFLNIVIPELQWQNVVLKDQELVERVSYFFYQSVQFKCYDQQMCWKPSDQTLVILLKGKLFFCIDEIKKSFSDITLINIQNELTIAAAIKLFKASKGIFHLLNEQSCTFLSFERRDLDYLRIDFIKLDREKKNNFLNKYLFCQFQPLYSNSQVRISHYRGKEKIPIDPDKISLIYQGHAQMRIQRNGMYYQIQLLDGTILDQILQQLENSNDSHKSQYIFTALKKTTIITIQKKQFLKCCKATPQLKQKLKQKINEVEGTRNKFVSTAQKVRQQIKQSQKPSYNLNYSLKMFNKKNSDFKVTKINDDQPQIQDFMSLDQYNRILQMKKAIVSKKEKFLFIKKVKQQTTQKKKQIMKMKQNLGKQKNHFKFDLASYFGVKKQNRVAQLSQFAKEHSREFQRVRSSKIYLYSKNKKQQTDEDVDKSLEHLSLLKNDSNHKFHRQMTNNFVNSEIDQKQKQVQKAPLSKDKNSRKIVMIGTQLRNSQSAKTNKQISSLKQQLSITAIKGKNNPSKFPHKNATKTSKNQTNHTTNYEFKKINTHNIIETLCHQAQETSTITPQLPSKFL